MKVYNTLVYNVIIMHRSGTFNVVGTCTDQFFAYKIALKKEYEFNP